MNEQLLDLLVNRLADRVARRLHDLQPAAGVAAAQAGSPWLCVRSEAVYLDWPAQRLYKLTARGEIPHYKQDGRLLFHRGELDRWLSQYAAERLDQSRGTSYQLLTADAVNRDPLGDTQAITDR
jgi:excisionase family DNA binding protein